MPPRSATIHVNLADLPQVKELFRSQGERIERLLTRVQCLNRLKVTPTPDGCGLIVDASAIARDDLDIEAWHLDVEPDGQWTHGPSGTTAPLGNALWAIASTYANDVPLSTEVTA